MKELFMTFSLQEIILFLILLALAIKGFVSFWDWAIDRLRKVFDKEYKEKEDKEDIIATIQEQTKRIEEIAKGQKEAQAQLYSFYNENKIHIENNDKLIQLLIDSDKDDIKAWITEQHHKFCYDTKCIDAYSLDCIEKRYSHYEDEGGNSFVADLMKDIRELPKYYTDELPLDKKENK